uniref:Uncharacterized protein n=1 Tax=Panagrolaimus davidi TaxID=227884 RepID=A0A914QD73_9BILA
MNSSNSLTSKAVLQEIDRITSNIKIPKSPPPSHFPSDVLRYIKSNPNLKQALYSMKVNKYFLHERSLINVNYPSPKLSKNFIEKICKSNLETLTLGCLPHSFEFEEFLNDIKKKPNLYVKIHFVRVTRMRKTICAYIDKILAAGIPDSCPPYFEIDDISNRNAYYINALDALRNEYRRNAGNSIL